MGVDCSLFARTKADPKVIHKLSLDRHYKMQHLSFNKGQWTKDIPAALEEIKQTLTHIQNYPNLKSEDDEPDCLFYMSHHIEDEETRQRVIHCYNELIHAFEELGAQWEEVVIAHDGMGDEETYDELMFEDKYQIKDIEVTL